MACSSSANDVIRYGDFTMYMDKKERSVIHIVNDNGKSNVLCEINNWKSEYGKGGGDLSITNDEKGGLFTKPINTYQLINLCSVMQTALNYMQYRSQMNGGILLLI